MTGSVRHRFTEKFGTRYFMTTDDLIEASLDDFWAEFTG